MDEHPPVRDRAAMLAGARPRRRPGRYVYTTGSAPPHTPVVMVFEEDEGRTLVLTQPDADAAGLPYDLVFAWLTLEVHSALDGVGLTAAVSGALADAGISCNVVAALRHDHLFVPEADADRAVAVLQRLADAHRAP